MKNLSIPAVSLLLLLAATPAWSQWEESAASGYRSAGLFGESAFSYGFVDLDYRFFSFEDEEIDDSSGFAGAVSVPIVDSFYIAGSLSVTGTETEDGEDLDYLDWAIGPGVGLPIGYGFDFVIDGGLARQKLEADAFEDPIDGYGWYISPGVRVGISDMFELNGGLTLMNIEDRDADLGLDFKALLRLTPNVSLSGTATFYEELNEYGLGVRLSF